MHLTPGVVHKFPKAVAVYDSCPLCTTTLFLLSLAALNQTGGMLQQSIKLMLFHEGIGIYFS